MDFVIPCQTQSLNILNESQYQHIVTFENYDNLNKDRNKQSFNIYYVENYPFLLKLHPSIASLIPLQPTLLHYTILLLNNNNENNEP